MKKFARAVILPALPFAAVIVVNEVVRDRIRGEPFVKEGIAVINSSAEINGKFTWKCHNNTYYCQVHHVKHLRPYYAVTDIPYFDVVAALGSTGNYRVANIIFLVILLPFSVIFLLISWLDIQGYIF